MSVRPITFGVATNNADVLNRNLLASPLFADKQGLELILQEGFPSAAAAYNDAIERSSNDLIVFAHQDMYFPKQWEQQLGKALAQLEEIDPNWGVLGCWGITEDGEHRGHLDTSTQGIHGVPFSRPERVHTLDEVVLIMRKSSGLRFDEKLPHFHLYAADLCLNAQRSGRNNYVICAPCFHNTTQGPILPREFYKCCSYMRKKWWSSLPVNTTCARLTRWNYWLYRRRLYEIYLRMTAGMKHSVGSSAG